MAKLTDKTALAEGPAVGDLIHVVDVSDTTSSAEGTSKKLTMAYLFTSPTLTTPALGTPASGNLSNCTIPIFTEAHATSHTLSAAECYGAVYYVTGAGTLTLPPVADGMHLSVITIGAVAVSIDPNAADKIWLDGTALDDGDKITNLSTEGDIAVLTYYSADGWHASTNSWTDGGA